MPRTKTSERISQPIDDAGLKLPELPELPVDWNSAANQRRLFHRNLTTRLYTRKQRAGMAMLVATFRSNHMTEPNGEHIDRASHIVRWLLEQIAELNGFVEPHANGKPRGG